MRAPAARSLAESRQFSQQALAAMERNEWPLAEDLASRAVEACREDAEARQRWAEVLWRRGDHAQAVAELEQISGKVDDPAGLQVRIARMQLAMGQTALARETAERAVDLAPRSPAAWAVRGQVMRAGGQTSQALADYQRALSLAPDDRTVALEVAELYRELNRPQRALAALSSLAASYPPGEEPGQILYLEGLALAEMGRHEDAVESFTRAIVRDRPTVEILYQLARAEMLAGRAGNAAAAAREALALDPRHQPSLDLLGRSRLELRPAAAVR
jgi:tetratricopeptide (TPR) repeat protein